MYRHVSQPSETGRYAVDRFSARESLFDEFARPRHGSLRRRRNSYPRTIRNRFDCLERQRASIECDVFALSRTAHVLTCLPIAVSPV